MRRAASEEVVFRPWPGSRETLPLKTLLSRARLAVTPDGIAFLEYLAHRQRHATEIEGDSLWDQLKLQRGGGSLEWQPPTH